MMQKVFFIIIGFVFSSVLFLKGNIDWNADLDYLAVNLAEKHYDFFTVHDKDYFLAEIDALKEQSSGLSDFEVAIKIQQLLAEFGDSHTGLNINQWLEKNEMLPVHLFWTSDGIHILHTTAKNKEILGKRIIAINDNPVSTIIDSLSTLIVVDNNAIVKLYIPHLIPSIQLLQFFGFADKPEVKLTLDDEKTYLLKAEIMDRNNRISFKPDSLAFSTINEQVFFTDEYYPEEKIYYMMYNSCWSKELESKCGDKKKAKDLPSFKEFEKKAFKTFEEKPVDKIVFDMRYNGGGASMQGTQFIEKLSKYLKQHPNVKTYVVIGRSTFSSAIINAMDFKRLTNAVFVGEETAGKPNHFGEIKSFKLPSSGLNVGYSTKYFKYTEEEIHSITPDVNIEMSFSDFAKGIDPVYEWIKKQ